MPPPAIRSAAPPVVPPVAAPADDASNKKQPADRPRQVIDMVTPDARPTQRLATPGAVDAPAAPETRASPAAASPLVIGPAPGATSRPPIAWAGTLNGISPQNAGPLPGDRTLPIFNSRPAQRRAEEPAARRPPSDDPPAERERAPQPSRAEPTKRALLGRSEIDLSQYFIYAHQISASMKTAELSASAPVKSDPPRPPKVAEPPQRQWVFAAVLAGIIAVGVGAIVALRERSRLDTPPPEPSSAPAASADPSAAPTPSAAPGTGR